MPAAFLVYTLRASDEDEIFYVGKTFEGRKRFREHVYCARGGDQRMVSHKIRSVLERGAAIVPEIVFETACEAEAFTKEKALVAQYGRRDLGTGILCNHTDGGEGFAGVIITDAARAKMAQAKIGNRINVGRKRPDMLERFSKPVSRYSLDGTLVATFGSAREAAAGSGVSFGQISDCCLGKILRSRCADGWATFRFGSEPAIAPVIRIHGRAKRIEQVSADGRTQISAFSSAKEAGEVLKIDQEAIKRVARGEQQSAGGYIWRWVS